MCIYAATPLGWPVSCSVCHNLFEKRKMFNTNIWIQTSYLHTTDWQAWLQLHWGHGCNSETSREHAWRKGQRQNFNMTTCCLNVIRCRHKHTPRKATYTGSVRLPTSSDASSALTGLPGCRSMECLSKECSTVPPLVRSLSQTHKCRRKRAS